MEKKPVKRTTRKKAEPKKVEPFVLEEYIKPHMESIWAAIIREAKKGDIYSQKLIMEYVMLKPTTNNKIEIDFKDFDITKLIGFKEEE